MLAAADTSSADAEPRPGLVVSVVDKPPGGDALKLSQPLGRRGPTSIRQFAKSAPPKVKDSVNPTDPAPAKYIVRDRDLGQTFTVPEGEAFRLDAVTLRIGVPGDVANSGSAGAPVYLQILEVSGTPTINDNGTTGMTTVSASYPGKAMADDYITGETYTPLFAATGGVLPDEFAFGQSNSNGPTPKSQGTLLEFDLRKIGGPVLRPGGTYAFMVGFADEDIARALPLDNYDFINDADPSPEDLRHGPYAGGHVIRREGSVEFPWENLDRIFDPEHPEYARFPDFATRLNQQPSTWGRPDVDTYRDLVFWITGSPVDGATDANNE